MISRLVSFIYIVIFSTVAFAEGDVPFSTPIEWQRVNLQEKITRDIEKALSAIIEKDKFLVQVSVSLSKQKTFGVGGKGDGKAFALDKLGISKNSKAYKKAISISANTVFERVSGISVNVSLDYKATSEQNTQAKQFATNIVRSYINKNPNLKVSKINFADRESTEVHARNMEVARVSVKAAETLATAVKESNEKLANAVIALNAAITNTEVESKDGVAVPVKKKFPKSWQEIVLEFKLPLGLIIAALIVLFAMGGFKALEGKKVAIMAAQHKHAKETSAATMAAASSSAAVAVEATEAVASEASSGGGGSVNVEAASGTNEGSGFAQFQKVVEKHPQTAAYFVKVWLNMDTLESKETIALLPKMIPVQALVPVFATLEDDLKTKLRKDSTIALSAMSMHNADSFIVKQLVNNFLVNTVKLPPEVMALTSSMNLKEYVECSLNDTRVGGIFLNILQPEQLGRILTSLPQENISDLFESGINFNQEDIVYLSQALGTMLGEMRQDKEKSKAPIIDKGVELIPMLGPEREGDVFSMLAEAGEGEQLYLAASTYFPSELIFQFPSEQLRAMLAMLSPAKRAELYFALGGDEQKKFMAAVGDSGRLREIIDSELGQIKSDKKRLTQIETNHGKIRSHFIQLARTAIRSNEAMKEASAPILKTWLEGKGVDLSDEQLGQAA